MRGKLAKAMRRHVRERYPFLHVDPIYEINNFGTIKLRHECQRYLYQVMKSTYKQRKHRGQYAIQ